MIAAVFLISSLVLVGFVQAKETEEKTQAVVTDLKLGNQTIERVSITYIRDVLIGWPSVEDGDSI